MNLDLLLNVAVRPALKSLEAEGINHSRNAERFILAIALQESRAKHRKQLGQDGRPTGPANGYWQFERGGGVTGVLNHRATAERIRNICKLYDIEATPQALWEAIRYHDIAAACLARLLIYTLPSSLPTTAEEGWKQYIAAWRPGKPHPQTWNECWRQADEATK